MKSPDEIKKGLECCTIPLCDECPYDNEPSCVVKNADALALIQQLQAENAEQAERIKQLEAERDAMMEYVHGRCPMCKHYARSIKEEPCASCYSASGHNDNWEWRGAPKEESDA